MADVVIVGAGISGAASAYHLARAGLRVVLVDRFGPAAMASGWSLAGVRQSGRHPAELPLAREAVGIWASLGEELGADVRYRRGGNLRLARTPEEVPVIEALVASQAAAGLDIRLLHAGPELRAVAPALSERMLAAALCPSDGHADPVATVAAYLAAAQRHGAELRYGERVLAIETARGRVVGVTTETGRIATERVVVAAGVFGNELLEPLGLAVPLQIPMVTVLRSVPMATVLTQVIGVANADCAGRQEADGRFRVTSGLQDWHGGLEVEPSDGGRKPVVRPTARSLAEVVDRFAAVVPAFAEARIESAWAGLIDLTPDALPVLDAPPDPAGLVIAMGFSGHGFCLGPVTGRIVADLVQECRPAQPITAFAIDRFATLRGPREAATLHG